MNSFQVKPLLSNASEEALELLSQQGRFRRCIHTIYIQTETDTGKTLPLAISFLAHIICYLRYYVVISDVVVTGYLSFSDTSFLDIGLNNILHFFSSSGRE